MRSGVAIPSIKFYLREGLIEAGERSSPNQASYDDRHVERLRLVRALIDVGGLSVASVRAVLAAVDDDSMPLDWAFGRAQRAIPGALPPEGEPLAESRGTVEIETLLAIDDWQISKGNPGRPMAAQVIDSYEKLGLEPLIRVLPAYLEAARIVARADLDAVGAAPDRASMVETVVVGTVLGDSLFAGLRRIAQERESRSREPARPRTSAESPEDDCDTDAEEATP